MIHLTIISIIILIIVLLLGVLLPIEAEKG
jgi:hypothetical protein